MSTYISSFERLIRMPLFSHVVRFHYKAFMD
jgi:hypothetical protein